MVADAHGGDGQISGILAFLGLPITANRMPKRGIGKGGLNAVKQNQGCVGTGGGGGGEGVWALFPFVERNV